MSRYAGEAALVGLAALCLAAWLPDGSARGREAEFHMIDVGQGDAIAVRTPKGRWLLFDGGRGWRGGDAGRSTIIPYLRRRGGTLEAVVLSHPHADHVGGFASILRALRPPEYRDAAFAAGSEIYRASLVAAREMGVRWSRVHPADSLVVDGVVVTFLAPDSTWTASLTDPNLASTIAMVRFGSVRFLLTGDAERAEEEWLLAHGASLKADVLKVGHHGSSTSSTDAFLDAVRPRAALVSVGVGNMYGHPSRAVMRALAARGAQVLRTDQLGSIVVRTDGRSLRVEAGGDEWTIPESSHD